MDYFLLLISLIFIILGVLGSFLPVLPGPPLSWIGIFTLYFIPKLTINYTLLIVTFVLALIITVLDYVIPAQGTKRFGGSKYGIWGTNIGLIVGIFAPIPFGFILGPFIGALVGELLFDSKNVNRALKAASGSFIGFLASTFIKFVFCMSLLGYYFYVIISNSKIWF